MTVAAFVKFNQFPGDLGLGVHDLNTGTVNVYLSNTAPNVATMAVKADLAEIATGNGYTGPVDIQNTYAQSGGVGTMTGFDVVITATGSVGPFRYAVLYNDTPTAPADPLIGYYDYGSAITMSNGETFTVDFGASVLTIT